MSVSQISEVAILHRDARDFNIHDIRYVMTRIASIKASESVQSQLHYFPS